jgi:hypothetical protein
LSLAGGSWSFTHCTWDRSAVLLSNRFTTPIPAILLANGRCVFFQNFRSEAHTSGWPELGLDLPGLTARYEHAATLRQLDLWAERDDTTVVMRFRGVALPSLEAATDSFRSVFE